MPSPAPRRRHPTTAPEPPAASPHPTPSPQTGSQAPTHQAEHRAKPGPAAPPAAEPETTRTSTTPHRPSAHRRPPATAAPHRSNSQPTNTAHTASRTRTQRRPLCHRTQDATPPQRHRLLPAAAHDPQAQPPAAPDQTAAAQHHKGNPAPTHGQPPEPRAPVATAPHPQSLAPASSCQSPPPPPPTTPHPHQQSHPPAQTQSARAPAPARAHRLRHASSPPAGPPPFSPTAPPPRKLASRFEVPNQMRLAESTRPLTPLQRSDPLSAPMGPGSWVSGAVPRTRRPRRVPQNSVLRSHPPQSDRSGSGIVRLQFKPPSALDGINLIERSYVTRRGIALPFACGSPLSSSNTTSPDAVPTASLRLPDSRYAQAQWREHVSF